MKHPMIMRITALTAVLAMMLCAFCACTAKPEEPQTEPKSNVLANGNVVTVNEQGSEAELTAVRESLIKATETKDLGEITKMEFYENGVRTTSDKYVQVKDNKKFYYAGDIKRVVNYPDGYMLDMPQDWVPDFTLSSARSTYSTDEVTLVVSDETKAISIYGTSEDTVKTMFQFIGTDSYCQQNRVKKIAEQTTAFDDEFTLYLLKLELQDSLEGTKRFYTYAVMYSELKITYMMFKCVDDRDFADVYMSYKSIYDKGVAVDTLAYPEGDNPSWNEETIALYRSIQNTEKVMWGMVNGNIDDDPLKLKYPLLENKLDFKFPVVTSYTDQLTYDFPAKKAEKIDKDGRIIQFTYHYDYAYGNTMGNRAPILDVYRGELDDEFREFARGVVEYGRPMLFRLNNEMNSDWTSWAAVNALLDPDIFTATWIRMYNIFEEEGANQYLIWVWNPQGWTTAPMNNWNDVRLYFPGVNYVDMLGLTAYNFGHETDWSTFGDMYQALHNYYTPMFGDWAWIISEFGCSDSSDLPEHENRKAEWITEMFDCFEQNRFPNIKVAVWFNANDYDGNGNITHEIALGRDPAAMDAFKEGLKRTQ